MRTCERCGVITPVPAKIMPGAFVFGLFLGGSPLNPLLCNDCAGLYNLYALASLVVFCVGAFVLFAIFV